MHHPSLAAFVALALGGSAGAQATGDFHPTTTLRNAGTYHVSTGSWTRDRGGQAHLGPDVIYNNRFDTGQFLDVSSSQEVIDAGRVPSTSAVPIAGAVDSYVVNGFQVAYCTRQMPVHFGLTVAYFNDYGACNGPGSSSSGRIATFLASGGAFPASSTSGTLACWAVTVDLANTTSTFCLTADVDGAYDTGGLEDTFGWLTRYTNVAGGIQGPIVSGSCSPQSSAPGQGTYYDSPSASGTTGLGTGDFFWIEDSVSSVGCFFFGGCNGNDNNPYASFWQVLFADTSGACDGLGTMSCPSPLNSTGSEGLLTASGSAQVSPLDVTFTAQPVPNTAGLLFFGNTQVTPTGDFGEGLRCAGGSVRRVHPTGLASGNSRGLTLDGSAGYASSILAGAPLHFQYWFRETMDAGDLDGDGMVEPFNTTNSVSITFW